VATQFEMDALLQVDLMVRQDTADQGMRHEAHVRRLSKGQNQEQFVALAEHQLQVQFTDPMLLLQALTHGSSGRKSVDYQRLEFLGDRVLGLVIAELIYIQNRSETEGQMAVRHSALVRGDQCASVGDALKIDELIIVGASEKLKGVQRTRSIIGDVVEALIGAIFLDGGLPAARAFIERHWTPLMQSAALDSKDHKTFLQEWALARALSLPRYDIAERTGPEHQPEFTVHLRVGTHELAAGRGRSKQIAEMDAARNFLIREGLRTS
jgi:ribonuclease III